jgi:transposase
MIEADKRKAIFLLHQEGMPLREIARRLHVSRNTVAVVIAQGGQLPKLIRSPKQKIDTQLLQRLYEQCGGWIQCMHEKLAEEQGIEVKYSTLTRMLRQSGISKSQESRCGQVPVNPVPRCSTTLPSIGSSSGEQLHRVVASLLYLRYSKGRYLKFYRCFNRFQLKRFLHEALTYWGYVPRQCIIDNTNLARLRGTGAQAVIVPEMEAFARQYGFQFRCHEKGHSDRKAGEERSFWTVETNFLAGRSFLNINDLNCQALEWATVRMEYRPQGKARLIPAKAFEHERCYLSQLPAHLPAP